MHECLRARVRACSHARLRGLTCTGSWAGAHVRAHTNGMPASLMQRQNASQKVRAPTSMSSFGMSNHSLHAARAKALAAGHLRSLPEGVHSPGLLPATYGRFQKEYTARACCRPLTVASRRSTTRAGSVGAHEDRTGRSSRKM